MLRFFALIPAALTLFFFSQTHGSPLPPAPKCLLEARLEKKLGEQSISSGETDSRICGTSKPMATLYKIKVLEVIEMEGLTSFNESQGATIKDYCPAKGAYLKTKIHMPEESKKDLTVGQAYKGWLGRFGDECFFARSWSIQR